MEHVFRGYKVEVSHRKVAHLTFCQRYRGTSHYQNHSRQVRAKFPRFAIHFESWLIINRQLLQYQVLMDELEIMQRFECARAHVRLDEFAEIGDKLVDCVYRL
jgi:hypothetical protein